jgi:Fe(3+) dicitrate transport protein
MEPARDHRLILLNAIIVAVFVAEPARAEEVVASLSTTEVVQDAGPVEVGSIIVTGTRLSDELPEVSGPFIFAGKLADVTVMADLPVVEGRNLRLAFSDIPGLFLSEVSNGSWASVSYRGLGEPHESWNLLTLADAVPLVPDPYSYPAAYTIPPLELVERVEFIRGGAGLLHGPQPGGVLNYALVGPRRTRGSEGLLKLARASDGYRSALGRLAISNGSLGLDGQFVWNEGDGPREVNSDFDQRNARLRGAWTSDRLTATVALDMDRGRYGEPGGLSFTRFASDRKASSTRRDRLFVERIVPSAAVEWDVDEDWHLTARGWYSAYERTSWRQAGGSFGEVTPDANVLVRQTQLFRTGAFDLRVRRDIGDHVLTLGAMAFRSSSPVRVDKGASNADFDGTAGAISRVSRKGDVLAAFAEAKFDLGRLQLVPGVRLERLRQRVTERLDLALGSVTGGAPGAPNGQLGRRRNAQAVLLWGLGATLDARPGLRLVGNASRGFKPLLYNDGVTFQAGIDAAEEFEASYATSLEAGVQWRPFRAARIDASLFRVELDDQVGFLAGPLPAAAPFGTVGVGGARRQNVGSMRNDGLDLSASLDVVGRRGLVASGAGTLRIGGNAQLLDARFRSGPAAGFRPQYAPERVMRASARWIGTSGLQAALLLTAVGRQNGSDNGRPEFDIPAYEVVDLSFDLPIAGPLTLGAGVTNLFDAAYWARVRPGAGQGIDPGRSRQAYLSFGARF